MENNLLCFCTCHFQWFPPPTHKHLTSITKSHILLILLKEKLRQRKACVPSIWARHWASLHSHALTVADTSIQIINYWQFVVGKPI